MEERTKEHIIISRIIANSLLGVASKEEEQQLDQWLKKSPNNKFFYNRFLEESKLEIKMAENEAIDIENAKAKIKKRYRNHLNLKKVAGFMQIAAIFIVILGGLYFFEQQLSSGRVITDESLEHEITLELDDGNIQLIKSDGKSMILNKKGEVVVHQSGNTLNYQDESKNIELAFNTLTIPYGKTFKVKLSDETVVHLNAGSSLRYPVQFLKGQDRKVYLEGRGIF